MIPDALGVAKSQTAIIEYETSEASDAAVAGLSGIAFGELKLLLQRIPQSMANMLLQPSKSTEKHRQEKVSNPLLDMPPTSALQLSNMIAADDLRDDELYSELIEDVADECNTHGTVRSIVIPRPVDVATSSNDYSQDDKDAGIGTCSSF